MQKKLVICCDGTWQALRAKKPTNVVKFSQACKPATSDGIPQVLYYQEGIGANESFLYKMFAGAFGWGIDKNIQDAYRFLCLNYEKGDQVYLFGFSRGAYTVRSLAGMIYCSGLLPRNAINLIPKAYAIYRDRNIKPKDKDADAFRTINQSCQIDITLIGCWDTVGALGVPRFIDLRPRKTDEPQPRKKYEFHDTQLNRKIHYAFHAVAIDERRRPYRHTSMNKSGKDDLSDKVAPTKIQEFWFPGTHGCVGGGFGGDPEDFAKPSDTSSGGAQKNLTGLSDAALLWMIQESCLLNPALNVEKTGFKVGLEFDTEWLQNNTKANHETYFSNSLSFPSCLMCPFDRDMGDDPVRLHQSVIDRYCAMSDYRHMLGRQKKSLKEHLDTLIDKDCKS